MTDKKNIERLFQEKFKDFEVTPAPEAWENIAAKLEKKEDKKRIFPFWFNAKAAGIAAALVLGFFGLHNYSNLFTWTLNSDSKANETVVQQNSFNSNSLKNENTVATSTKNDSNTTSATPKTASGATINKADANATESANAENKSNPLVKASPTYKKEGKTPSNSYKNIQPSVKYLNNANEVFVSNEKSKKEKTNNGKLENTMQRKSALTLQENELSQNELSQNKELISTDNTSISKKKKRSVNQNNILPITTTSIASKDKTKNESSFEKVGKEKVGPSDLENITPSHSSVVSTNKPVFQKNEKTLVDHISISNDKETSEKNKNASIVAVEINKTSVEANSNNASDEVNTNKSTIIPNASSAAIVAIDSSKNSKIEENPLEKILREKEQEKLAKNTEEKKEKKKSDWLIKPTVAPIFMFAKNGSPIDEKFVDNTKSYNNTMSVGIGLEKRLSDKFYFRTSVNSLDLSYNTNDIAYYSTLNFSDPTSRGMGNISVNQSALFTTIVDSKDAAFEGGEVLQNKKEGYLNQKISYVEIPFEVSYKIVDRKLGIQIMTGLSTLFLNKNQVSLVAEKFSSDLGEANNLNIIHFSTNVGVGFKYKIFKSFEASVEPTLKYQLFTFHTNAGGFKPYIVGLYSGVSYRF